MITLIEEKIHPDAWAFAQELASFIHSRNIEFIEYDEYDGSENYCGTRYEVLGSDWAMSLAQLIWAMG